MGHMNMEDPMIREIKVRSAMRDRVVYIVEEIDRDVSTKIRHLLDRIVAMDEFSSIEPKNAKPIEIRIDCYGGSAHSTLYLCNHIEYLQSLGYIINTVCCGVAMSGGFKILITGTNRSAYKYSDIMCHQQNCWKEGVYTYKDIELDYDASKKLLEKLKSFISSKTKITSEQFDWYVERNRDWFMTSEEAIEFGVIDYII